MFSPNGVFAQLTALLRAKYGNPSSEVTPEEAEVGRKLFKVFNVWVTNANIDIDKEL
jgi:hypothetical protein